LHYYSQKLGIPVELEQQRIVLNGCMMLRKGIKSYRKIDLSGTTRVKRSNRKKQNKA